MINQIITTCEQSADRLAQLGQWPAYIDRVKSLVGRIPTDEGNGPGFDAGLACALDLIPRNRQQLAATLHAAYTEVAVEQVRRESGDMNPDSETCWWLAACSICKEDHGVNAEGFLEQIEAFRQLAGDPVRRAEVARAELGAMKEKFRLMDGIPFVVRDGGLQGAYVSGHDWGIQYVEAYGLNFIGTFRASLGLENFKFSDRVDVSDRPMSGPVHGSRQFVKVSSFDELARAVECVRSTLG